MQLGKNIRYLRKENNLSQDELAAFLGYKSFTTIQKWESGVAETPTGAVLKMANRFKVGLDEFVKEDIEYKRANPNRDARLEEFGKKYKKLSEANVKIVDTLIDSLLEAQNEK